MAARKGQQLAADPAERALRAAQECREATREAHEAIQALAEMRAGLRADIAEARQFTLAHVAQAVPTEVKRQLDALLPVAQQAMRDAVDKVGKEFERIEALFLGKEDPGKPSLEELITARQENAVRCPYCGHAGSQEPVGDDKELRPQASGRSVSVCGNCLQPSIFVTGPLPGDLSLRELTPVEARQLAKNSQAKQALRVVRKTMRWTEGEPNGIS